MRCNSAVNHTHGISDSLSDYNSCSYKRIIPQQFTLSNQKNLGAMWSTDPYTTIHEIVVCSEMKKIRLRSCRRMMSEIWPCQWTAEVNFSKQKRKLLEQICKSLHSTPCQLRDIWTFEQSRDMEYLQGVPQGKKTNKGRGAGNFLGLTGID